MFSVGRFVAAATIALLLGGCGGTDTAPSQGTDGGESEDRAAVKGGQPVGPLPRHPPVELSNLRFGESFSGEETFSVDWSAPPAEGASQWTLIVKPTSSTSRMELTEWFSGESGTLSGQTVSFGPRGDGPGLESGCEVYLVSKEGDLEFKISNSLTTGGASETEARPATDAELEKLQRDLAALPPEAAGFVPVPEGVILPEGAPIKARIGRSLVDATVISHDPATGILKGQRHDTTLPTLGPGTDYLIAPNVLEDVKKNAASP